MNRKSFLATLFAAPLALVGVKMAPPAQPFSMLSIQVQTRKFYALKEWKATAMYPETKAMIDTWPLDEQLEIMGICEQNPKHLCRKDATPLILP